MCSKEPFGFQAVQNTLIQLLPSYYTLFFSILIFKSRVIKQSGHLIEIY